VDGAAAGTALGLAGKPEEPAAAAVDGVAAAAGGDWKQRWFVLRRDSLACYGSAKAASKASLLVDTSSIVSVGLLQGHDAPPTATVKFPGDDDHMGVSLYVQYRLDLPPRGGEEIDHAGADVDRSEQPPLLQLARLRAESADEAQQWVESIRSVVFKH
jgi:hypothetical protein